MERSLRAGDRHRADPRGGVHSDRFSFPESPGGLYQQFAVTIAISVIISAFNALTLSPALSALLLRPRSEDARPARQVLRLVQSRLRPRDRRLRRIVAASLIRKSARQLSLLLVVLAVGAGLFGAQLPSGFLPEEDQGYVYVALQLPDAASLAAHRRSLARKVEEHPERDARRQVLHQRRRLQPAQPRASTYSAFFFVTLKPWSERNKPDEQYDAIRAHIEPASSPSCPKAIAFAFPPPAIPGVGTSGGFTFVLEDRAGKDIEFLAENLNTFLARRANGRRSPA